MKNYGASEISIEDQEKVTGGFNKDKTERDIVNGGGCILFPKNTLVELDLEEKRHFEGGVMMNPDGTTCTDVNLPDFRKILTGKWEIPPILIGGEELL